MLITVGVWQVKVPSDVGNILFEFLSFKVSTSCV